jgi:cysteine desulfurase / selenocysteine lyase
MSDRPGTQLPAPKSDFVGLEHGAYLYTAGQSPPLKSHREALGRWVDDKARGPATGAALEATVGRAKATVADLLGVESSDLALLGSSSDISNLLARSLAWREGDNVVINNVDFPSNIYPWLRLREAGVAVRVARQRDWYVALDDLIGLIDERTRVVIVSQVSWLTGQRHNLARLAEACHANGARLFADVTHAFGVVEVPAALCDVAFSSCYKWILGGTGVAVLYWNRERWPDLEPPTVGWHSVEERSGDDLVDSGFTVRADARRFEVGNPPHPSVYLLENGAGYIAGVGQQRIQEHVLELGDWLLRELRELGLEVMTPLAADERAGNYCFATPRAETVQTALHERDVQVVGRDGRVRISPHLFNDRSDVENLVEALHDLRRQQLI